MNLNIIILLKKNATCSQKIGKKGFRGIFKLVHSSAVIIDNILEPTAVLWVRLRSRSRSSLRMRLLLVAVAGALGVQGL